MSVPNPDVHGPFEQSVFLGASVRSYQESIGWNEQSSSLTVDLVEDAYLSQVFSAVEAGKPVYFEYPTPIGQSVPSDREVHKFYGLLQSWERTNDANGNLLRVSVVDPREILAGVQLILDGYVGDVGFVRNVLNVFGFHEHQGVLNSYLFGNSGRTDAGIEWNKIKSAVQILTSPFSILSPFGRRVVFKDTSYYVDLTLMPTMPDDYRIGGTHNDLLSVIGQVCQDAGHDYNVRLTWTEQLGHVIKINTVSRKALPVMGSVQTFIESLEEGSFVASSIGRELRNEETNSILIGGQVTALWSVPAGGIDECGRFNEDPEGRNIWPFWGLDAYGNITVGNEFGNDHYIELSLPNTKEIEFNRPTYRLTVGEMRALLGGQTEWETYTQSVANKLNFDLGPTGIETNLNELYRQMAVMDEDIKALKAKPNGDLTVSSINAGILQATNLTNQQQLDLDLMYELLKSFVSTYYGKKFLVRLPVCNPDDRCRDPKNPLVHPCQAGFNTSVAYDSLNGNLITSWTPIDAGFLPEQEKLVLSVSGSGYVGSSGGPVQLITQSEASLLGLSQWGIDFFRVEDGRIQCFVVFDNIYELDLSNLQPDDYIIENELLYLKATVEPDVVFVDRARGLNPYVVVTLPNSINLLEESYLNQRFYLLSELAATRGIDFPGTDDPAIQNKIAKALMAGGGDTNRWDGAQEARRPIIATIPLESKNLTYGPWYWLGAVGRVRYEQDESLTPWNFGSIEDMNTAAQKLVAERISNLQEAEMGYVEYAGIPIKNIGDALIANGPYIDSITMQVGAEGFTTRYTFRTFTPAFGTLAKYNADKLKKLGAQNNKQEMYIRELYKKANRGTKQKKQ